MSTPESTAAWCPPQPPPGKQQDRRQPLFCVSGSLAHLRWRPLLITGVLRHLLINHFADARNIEDPDLRSAVWTDGPATGIMVESVHRWLVEPLQKRPAVLVKRNAYRNLRVTIADLWGTDGQGFEHYQTLWVGSHTLFCVHGSGAGCEILATEVQRELTQFAPAVRRLLGLHRLQVTEVGGISEVEEARQHFAVPITVGWCYQEAWKLHSDALPLMGISFELNAHDC